MAIFKGKNSNKYWQGNRKLYTLLVGMQFSTTIMESSINMPQKAKNKTSI
jgi:hypothetical protein